MSKQQQQKPIAKGDDQQCPYHYYSLRMRDGAPRELQCVSLRGPARFELALDVGWYRKFFEPRGLKPHDDKARLREMPDVRWLRLSNGDAAALRDWLSATTIKAAGIASVVFDDPARESVVEPNPTLDEIVELRRDDPRNWRDLWFDEYRLELAHPVREADVEALVIRSPVTPEAMATVDAMMRALIARPDLPARAALDAMTAPAAAADESNETKD